jgi:RNase P subunit RPR2
VTHQESGGDRADAWLGFACKKCHAPVAVQRCEPASRAGEKAARGWRVTCTTCGETTYYEPGTRMVKITLST